MRPPVEEQLPLSCSHMSRLRQDCTELGIVRRELSTALMTQNLADDLKDLL